MLDTPFKLSILRIKDDIRNNTMAPNVKLVYFNLPGRAELIRLILHVGKVCNVVSINLISAEIEIVEQKMFFLD